MMSEADRTKVYRDYWIGVLITNIAGGFQSEYRVYEGESAPKSASPVDSRGCRVLQTREAAIEKAVVMAKERIDVLCGGKATDPRGPKGGAR